MFAEFRKKLYFCRQLTKNDETMNMLNAYFYGYYFYFTAGCEAVDRM